MTDTDDEIGAAGRPHRSRRVFIQSAGVAGLGLTAGASIATSEEDGEADDESGSASAADESDDCPPTELEPGLHKFTPDDGEEHDDFGDSVSIDGDTALVARGSLLDPHQVHDFIADPVTAYVFTYDGESWCQQAKLVADEGGSDEDDPDHHYGSAVSIDGDTAIVGDFNYDGDDPKTGAAFVFTRDGDGESWSQQAKITPEVGERYRRFGRAVSLDGDTLLVGAHLADGRGFNAGTAYVFERDGGSWSQRAKLLADDGQPLDVFGQSVSLEGDTALVGAPLNDENGTWSGAAYVFERDGGSWTQRAKLLTDDGAERDQFGTAVDLDGDTVVVGAPYNDEIDDDAGATYVFERDGGSWSQRAKLLAHDGAAREQFGWSVGLDGDRAVVGTWDWTRAGATATGTAYTFARDEGSWTQEAALHPPDGEGGDTFGRAVAIDDETILAGAVGSDVAGAAYAFHLGTWEPTEPDDEDPDGDPTEIDSCTVITEPGEYELVADLAPGELDQPACITIDSRDVTFRGNGHTIDASDATHSPDTSEGDVSEGYERPPCIAVHPYTNGLGESNWDTLVEDVVVRGGFAGVAARLTHSEQYTDVRAVDNDHGFLFETASVLLKTCVAEDNDRGVTAEDFLGSARSHVADCTLRGNGTGLWIDQEMDVTVDGSRIVENDTGVHAVPFTRERHHRPTTVSIEGCHICRNADYGVHARTDPLADDCDENASAREGVVLAVDNYWGAADGPSSFADPPEPYADPETGRPADGDGDAVSKSLEPGVSNVRFDPFHESTLDGVGADR